MHYYKQKFGVYLILLLIGIVGIVRGLIIDDNYYICSIILQGSFYLCVFSSFMLLLTYLDNKIYESSEQLNEIVCNYRGYNDEHQ